MADYGHELLFGTFLTPSADAPDRVIALAQLTEQAGLDLVTVQDHPYQPRLLDAWTLLSVIGARTSRITVAPNVANLPLRHPAVLARSAASLDLITAGRVELGLGAGAFWDAIEANGGPRRSGPEAVDALTEAIGVIRALWDTGTPGGARIPGEYYPLTGAKRGPAPAHDIGIWLGALKPRMLRLTGRLADGWWVSSGYLPPETLTEHNRVIDEAATKAGRSPCEIRRLYNVSGTFDAPGNGFLQGPETVWAEQLTELTLTHGMTSYIIATDDPDEIRRFADVATEVRAAVTAARTAGTPDVARPEPRSEQPEQVARPLVEAPRVSGLDIVPTADTGVRLSGTKVWDESERPSGPSPEPGQSYPHQAGAQQLIGVHDHLRGELDQLRDLVDQVRTGAIDPAAARSAINQMTMRQNNWTLGAYCESYCRLVTTHHTLEDQAVFPRLRHGDPRLGPVLDRLAHEHTIIHDVLEQVDQALVALVTSPDGMPRVTAAMDLLSDTLLSHLSYEERELVEPLSRLGF